MSVSPGEWKPLFIEKLRAKGSVTDACKAIGIGRTTAYRHRGQDPEFSALWAETEEVELDNLEHSAFERARDGWLEPVFYQGEQCGLVRRFDNRLAEFFLSRRRREKYSDKALQHSIDQFAAALREFGAAARRQDTAEGDESAGPGAADPAVAPNADAPGTPPTPDVPGAPPSSGGGPP